MSAESSSAIAVNASNDRASETHARPLATDYVFALILFAAAFVLRFTVASALAGEPVWDGHYYDFGAHRIAEGHGYSDDRVVSGHAEWHPWCHYPVGYSGYLAAFYWLFGAKPWVAHLANAITGSLLAVVVFFLGRTAFDAPRSEVESRGLRGFGRAHFAGVLTAIHPGLVLYGALVMGELLSALTVMLSFLVAIAGVRRWGNVRGIVAAAAILGLGALVRPQALLCAPFLALVGQGVPVCFRPIRSAVKGLLPRVWLATLACGVALAVVSPWTVRNCRVMDGCALVSTNAGWNLAIGSFPRATGRFETLRSSDGCREVTGQVQQDRCWLEYGLANIKARPGFWLGLIPAKLSNTFDHESFAVEYLREARPESWPEPRRVAWRTAISSLHRVLVMLSPLAFVAVPWDAIRRRRLARGKGRWSTAQGVAIASVLAAAYVAISSSTPTFWPIIVGTCVLAFAPLPGRPPSRPALTLVIVLVATTAITHAIFFGDDRYHMVITPALCLLAAALLRGPHDDATPRVARLTSSSPPRR